jgi:hypothetical protein
MHMLPRWNMARAGGMIRAMNTLLTTYLFRDGPFAPFGNTVVCVVDRTTIEGALGRGFLEALFAGGAVYTDDAAKRDDIGCLGRAECVPAAPPPARAGV